MTNLLVELQTEELPPKALDTLSKAFGNEIAKSLAAQHLTEAGSVATCYGTPRRRWQPNRLPSEIGRAHV